MKKTHETLPPKIGIMQGRLSPPQGERLQFFPKDWRAEFPIAEAMGLYSIEWYLDHSMPMDPVNYWLSEGIPEELAAKFPVFSMDIGKFRLHGEQADRDARRIIRLINRSPCQPIRIFNLPIMEDTAMKTKKQRSEVYWKLSYILNAIGNSSVQIALETDLSAAELLEFLSRPEFSTSRIGVCYDIGNCTSYGFDCPREIELLGERILEVRIKDRKVSSSQSVLLGTGDADFKGCFQALRKIGYGGQYIMQAWRGQDYLQDAKVQLAFVKSIFRTLNQERS